MSRVQYFQAARTIGLMGSMAVLTMQPAMAQATSFFDDFNSLDSQRWYVSDGWANGAHQNCAWSAGQVKVIDGMLNVGFAPGQAAGRAYQCGEIQTRQAHGYGTYEARLKTPAGSGLNAAFFTYIGPQQQKPHDEIDFEILMKDTSAMQTTTFVNGKSGDGKVGSGQDHKLPYPSDSDFTDYAMTWAPDKIEFFVNGELIRTMTEPSVIPTNPQRIFFSLWGTDTLTDWMGPFEAPAGPIAMQVDWVGFTAPGESCVFPQSVLCAQ